ncbi:MAG: hypothetical protein ACI97K_000008 [Glaciecola sp.]|jgi:hypothetical protein
MNNKITELNAKTLFPFSHQPLSELNELFSKINFSGLSKDNLNAALLSELQANLSSIVNANLNKRFVCQNLLPEDQRYYEQIIFEDHIIPTRQNSWHDFFNGLIWFRFPLTKAYLNSQHIAEIELHGLNPRSRVRNHITHFDECGVVLFIEGSDLYNELDNAFQRQDWLFIFCELRELWHISIRPVIFGHANLEMLLSPFIGLTGKVLLIEVNADVEKINLSLNCKENQESNYDLTLLSHIKETGTLEQKKPFYPLPLLGVPNWYYAEQSSEFYKNEAYFMPKRQHGAGV